MHMLFGEMKISPVKYYIRPMKRKGWIFTKKYYIVETDYMTYGEFDSVEAAIEVLTLGRVSINDIVIDAE